jgi:hypothetical protein
VIGACVIKTISDPVSASYRPKFNTLRCALTPAVSEKTLVPCGHLSHGVNDARVQILITDSH